MPDELIVEGLSVTYGARVAVGEISFKVGADECVALIGANGAGKTSTLNALVGITPAKSGSVRFGPNALSGRTPAHVAKVGVTLCPEGRHLFPAMSVHDNLLLGTTTSEMSRREIAELIAEMEERFPILGQRRTQLAGTLSGGEQQMVAIGRALMARPRLLILDEPTLGLAPMLVEQVLEIARSVVNEGCAVLISEQNVEATLDICDRGYVMEAGTITASGSARELKSDPRVLAAFIGMEETTTV